MPFIDFQQMLQQEADRANSLKRDIYTRAMDALLIHLRGNWERGLSPAFNYWITTPMKSVVVEDANSIEGYKIVEQGPLCQNPLTFSKDGKSILLP